MVSSQSTFGVELTRTTVCIAGSKYIVSAKSFWWVHGHLPSTSIFLNSTDSLSLCFSSDNSTSRSISGYQSKYWSRKSTQPPTEELSAHYKITQSERLYTYLRGVWPHVDGVSEVKILSNVKYQRTGVAYVSYARTAEKYRQFRQLDMTPVVIHRHQCL
jgi:hypothetical protein